MTEQRILTADKDYVQLDSFLAEVGVKRIMLVCGGSVSSLPIGGYFDSLTARTGIQLVRFSGFKPNPLYESVVEGVRIFNETDCDMVIAVGGGSAMDVAKCIKLYSNMDPTQSYLKQEIVPNDVILLAVPTTAGTGSEATRYAVIYYEGEKLSVTHESCIPSVVLMDAGALKTLPPYQKKCTMLDALCHGVESLWSVNSTEESRAFSKEAIGMIMENLTGYLANDDAGNANMLKAAHIAGKAINITQTTAGHAMSYKLTSLYGISHGHAVAMCILKIWRYMLQNPDKCIDPRGAEHLAAAYEDIAAAMGCVSVGTALEKYTELYNSLGLETPTAAEAEYEILKNSVNPVRLKNHPIVLDVQTIDTLYRQILA